MRTRVLVASLVAAVVFASLPHQVMAGTFSASVSFPSDAAPEEVTTAGFEGGAEPGTFFGTSLPSCTGGAQSSAQAHSGSYSFSAGSGDPLCRVAGVVPDVGTEYLFEWWAGDFGGAGSQRQAWGFCDSAGAFIGGFNYYNIPDGGWSPTTWIETAPAGAAWFCFKGDSDHTTYMDDLVIYGPAFDSDGCLGSGSMAWGGALMVASDPNYGDGGTLQQPTGWGDKHDAGLETCAVTLHASAHLIFEPPSTPAVGDTFMFDAGQFCTKDNINCGATVYWLDSEGERIDDPETGTYAAGWSWILNAPANPEGAQSMRQWADWPAGAEFIEIAIVRNTMSVYYSIANVEGTDDDPDDPDFDCDNYEDGTCGAGGGPDMNFQDCAPPVDPLDVPGWLEYVACLIDTGVALLLDAIATVALGVLDELAAVLEDLFVPTEIGTAWDEFMALFNSKVPMVWVLEVVDFLSGMLTAGNLTGAAIPTSIDVMGASVTVDFTSVFGPLASYRFVLVGLVYIAGAWAIFRAVGRAMGMGSEG